MRVYYGLLNKSVNVTEICYSKLLKNDVITIPANDNQRAQIFGDPIYGIEKKIFLLDDSNDIQEYDQNFEVQINTKTNTITTIFSKEKQINDKIDKIHNKLKIKYGSFKHELPEQKMAVRYLTGNEKVLEIGSNIGRNSLVIGYILENNLDNFVTLECDENISQQLKENRDLNNMNFHIETSALSKRNLIQKGWDTMVSDIVLDGYKKVNTITWDQLKSKYNINFDTLVLDCEGAFYYILIDMPEILENINLIIMENDYHDINHKNYVDLILKQNNFYVDYKESGGWGPCYNNFFEVWKKNKSD